MPTGSSKINVYEKRLLERTAVKDNFLDFLKDSIDEVSAAIFQGTAGILDDDEIEITSSSNDTFTLDITNASRCLVGGGQIIDLSLRPSSLYTTVAFENNTGSTYSVGIKYAEVETGIELNPRTGDPEYPKLLQTYGELDHPDSVTDNTTYIRLVIDTVTDGGDGEDHSGRTVSVWLADPVSGVESVAYWSGTTSYSASPGNYVDIPYTSPNGPLGQDTGVDPPSTTAADYWVFIEGPSWRDKANKDLSTDSEYAFIGEITGNGPAATPVGFDISGQVPIFINSLDRAYDGPTGSGSGRKIFVDAGAVEMRTRSSNTDELYGTLRLDRKGDTGDGGMALQTICDQSDGKTANAVHLTPLTHATGNCIVDNPGTSVNPDKIDRTGSVNWTTSNVSTRMDLAWLQGFSTIDGLYEIVSVGSTQLQLRNLDGTTPTFPGSETGNVTILRATMHASGARVWGHSSMYLLHGAGGVMLHGLNETSGAPSGNGGDDTYAALSLYGEDADNLRVYENYPTGPLAVTWIDKKGIFKTITGIYIAPSTAPQETPMGLFLTAQGVNSLTALEYAPISGNYLGGMADPAGNTSRIIESSGRFAEPHVQRDDFTYAQANWSSASNPPDEYDVTVSTNGTAFQGEAAGYAHGGCAIIRAPADTANEYATLSGGRHWYLDTAKGIYLRYFARCAFNYQPTIIGNRYEYHGLTDIAGGNWTIVFEHDNTTHGNNNWWLVVRDGVNPVEKVNTTIAWAQYDGSNNPQYINFYFAITGNQTIKYWIDGLSGDATFSLTTITFSGAATTLGLEAYEKNNVATLAEMYLDYWEVRDQEALSGTLGAQVY